MPNIHLSGREYSYTIEFKPIRSIRLRLRSSDSFVVSCHRLTPNFLITKFIHDHQVWITKNTAKFNPTISLSDIKRVSILDEVYKIMLRISRTDSVVILPEQRQIITNTTSISNTHLSTLYNSKFRPLALKLIKAELLHLSGLFGFQYDAVSVRNQSTRYGSCSFQGNLSFNWQIILFPQAIFRHVLLHELTHLTIKNHSQKYWRQLLIYDPDTKKHNLWLKNEATKHFLIHP